MNIDVQQRYEALNIRLMCLIILSLIYLAPVKAPFLCSSFPSIRRKVEHLLPRNNNEEGQQLDASAILWSHFMPNTRP